MRLLFWLLTGLIIAACKSQPIDPVIPDPHRVGIRQVPIAEQAYAGSSINVVAGSRQTLYTDSGYQYAGYYDERGQVVLAKRRLGEDSWHKHHTGFRTGVEDAHNTISLIIDGEGRLHLAWGHHNTPLQYTRGLHPGALTMGELRSMVVAAEQSVSYPQFFRLSDGNLLFLYRDGGSGDGRLVLNHYDTEQRLWTRRHDNLIDGERERSAYWDLSLDGEDRLHLAWTWRETPDVASNHDLLYARSEDGGRSWQRSNGEAYTLPITQGTAEVAAAIAQNHNLMNPPAIGTDRWGRPYISSYWSPEPGSRPRFHLVYRNDAGWETLPGPKAGEDFQLKGWGTKRPPISRAALLVESDWSSAWAHLIYRDDSRGGRVVAATVRDLQNPEWHYRDLTEESVGAWEPSIDPSQWQRMGQAHLLLQSVDQVDGDDQSGSQATATPLSLLIWSPDGGNIYTPSARVYHPPPDPEYPYHDRTIRVTRCGRICFGRLKVNLSTVFAGQFVGIREVEEQVWLVSFLDYDLGYFDTEKGRVEPAPNPFVPDRNPFSRVLFGNMVIDLVDIVLALQLKTYPNG